jgi:hypothetical protein
MIAWIKETLRRVFGEGFSSAICILLIGIFFAISAPRIFVTFETLAQQLSPLKRNDLTTEIKMLEFQRTQILIRKNDLEDQVDRQSGAPTVRQQGRLDELIEEATDLKNRVANLEKELKDCK